MASDNFTSLKGHFLMAMPSLADPNFRHSVTCISEHTPEGAVGIIVNQIYPQLNAKMIFDELGIECHDQSALIPIHIGGPVHSNELFVLHADPLNWSGHLMINEDLGLSNSRIILEGIGRGQGPRAFIIALGCAGWEPSSSFLARIRCPRNPKSCTGRPRGNAETLSCSERHCHSERSEESL